MRRGTGRELPKPDGWVWAAAALIASQTLWRGWAGYDAYFWQDDFRYLADARRGLSADLLLQNYNSHIMPGSFLASWFVVQADSSHILAASILIVLGLLASVLLAIALRLLFGSHPGTLVLLAGALFTPLTLLGHTWFAYGLQLWPQQIALLGCLCSYIAWRRSQRVVWCATAVLALLFGLFAWEKALLVVPTMLLLALLTTAGTPRARLRSVVAQWRWFAAPLLIMLAYVVAYIVLTQTKDGAAHSGTASIPKVLSNGILRLFLPGLIGGPWSGDGAFTTLNANPNNVTLASTTALWAMIVGVSLWRSWKAVRAWVWFGAQLLADLMLLVIFRGDAAAGIAMDSRYLADLVPVAAISVGWAFMPERMVDLSAQRTKAMATSEAQAIGAAQWRIPLVMTAAIALCASSWVTVQTMSERLANSFSRNYVVGLDRAIRADPTQPVLEGNAPSIAVFFGSSKEVADAMGINVNWASVGSDLKMVDGIGRLRPVTVADNAWVKRGDRKDCGWLLETGRELSIDLPASFALEFQILKIGVLSGSARSIALSVVGGPSATVRPVGLATVVMKTDGSARKVTMRLVGSGPPVCISDVSLGPPTPGD